MRIWGDRGITTTFFTLIIERAMGITSSDGLVRIISEGEELFSHGSEVIVMEQWLGVRLMWTCFIKQFRP
jgi:hypothetical protein